MKVFSAHTQKKIWCQQNTKEYKSPGCSQLCYIILLFIYIFEILLSTHFHFSCFFKIFRWPAVTWCLSILTLAHKTHKTPFFPPKVIWNMDAGDHWTYVHCLLWRSRGSISAQSWSVYFSLHRSFRLHYWTQQFPCGHIPLRGAVFLMRCCRRPRRSCANNSPESSNLLHILVVTLLF